MCPSVAQVGWFPSLHPCLTPLCRMVSVAELYLWSDNCTIACAASRLIELDEVGPQNWRQMAAPFPAIGMRVPVQTGLFSIAPSRPGPWKPSSHSSFQRRTNSWAYSSTDSEYFCFLLISFADRSSPGVIAALVHQLPLRNWLLLCRAGLHTAALLDPPSGALAQVASLTVSTSQVQHDAAVSESITQSHPLPASLH